MQTVVPFPVRNDGDEPGARLAEILEESAYLLEASRDSEDPDVRSAAIDLAVRSLKAATMALEPSREHRASPRPGKIVRGPWAAAQSTSS
jgi:hypothetical protein